MLRSCGSAQAQRWGQTPSLRDTARLVRVLAVGNMYPPQHLGGYELVWQGAMRALREAGHEVRVLTTDDESSARS